MPFTSINIYTLKQVRTKRRRYDLEDLQIASPSVCYQVLQYLLDLKSEPVERFGIIHYQFTIYRTICIIKP